MTIIVDSDGLIGLLNKDDTHNSMAMRILEKLTEQEAKLIYPVTVITESSTVLQVRLGKPEMANHITQLLLNGKLIIETVDEELLKQAVKLLKPGGSKHNTLFDAVVAEVAKKHNADAIFSFDRWYKQLGYKLASDLI